jgi:predicted helicase
MRPTPRAPPQTLQDPRLVRPVCGVAAPGSATPTTAAHRCASTTRPTPSTTTESASASREIHNAHIISNLHSLAPRIPCVKRAVDFRAFEQAGRELAKLHVNYESVNPYRLKMESTGKLTGADYRVEKMRYGKDQAKDKDKTTLHYNESITLTGIPLEAYEYVVNGKPALDWVVERQGVSTHKESGTVNDANDWAKETMKDPQYPLDLFCRVVTVSLDTMKIVNSLPKLDI